MQTLRTLVWVVVAVLLTLFAVINSQRVEVAVWPGYVAELPLSVLILGTFLLGFLPPYLVNKSNSWRLHRRLKQQDETIAMLRPAVVTPTVPASPDPQPNLAPLSATDQTP